MRYYELIDPDLRPMVDAMPTMTWNAETLEQVRGFMLAADPGPLPDLPVDVSTRHGPRIDGSGEVASVVYRPRELTGPLPTIVDMHGGGYVAGAAHFGGARNMALANDLGCMIVSVDYRLAPEAPFPAGLDDCYSVLEWVHAEAEALGVDRTRIALTGDSAGGGLAAALALMARDRGEVPLVAQILTYPMLDDRTASVTKTSPFVGEYMWTPESNCFGWECYLGAPAGSASSPYAAPARATDLAGLPPTLIAVGQLDLFVAEDIDYARRLIDAGVPTELHVYSGAFHGFDAVATSAASLAHGATVRQALRRAFRI
jgi:acetyl esterase/lipase